MEMSRRGVSFMYEAPPGMQSEPINFMESMRVYIWVCGCG